MPRNKMEDLRNHLFETLEMLKDGDMDINRARAVANVGKTIIDSAKVEVAYLNVVSRKGIESEMSLLKSDNDTQRLEQ